MRGVSATLCAMPSPAVDGGRLPAVVARSVSKSFTVPEERRHTLKERVLHPRRRIRHQTFRALNDISFAVAPGEFFGIAGRNGSGKSTLLKCIAGIYQAEGDIWCRGRLSTFIELGVGFNPDMAARDNVVMNGIMLGLTPREARKRYEAVIEFAELQQFKDLKLKNYSSGMHVRLAFSVAIQVDADVLLIDEVLAVGDAAFQQKCFDVFNEMRDSGKTIIFVTHDMGSMQRFCHRALLLERGSPVYMGDPHEVADRYLELNFGRDPEAEERAGKERSGDGEARVIEAWVANEQGERVTAVQQQRQITLSARVAFLVDVEDPCGERVCAQRGAQGRPRREHGDRERAVWAVPRRRRGWVLVHLPERAGPRSLQPNVHPGPSRLGAGRHRPLRGQLLVRRHRPVCPGWGG